MTTAGPGRRERKKAATRRALADAALDLFLARGFDAVTVADVADAADVSVTTLFKHFPSKEALLFDRETGQESDLVGSVRDRPDGVDVLTALHDWFVARMAAPHPSGTGMPTADEARRFAELANSTASLREYARRMWARHEDALADAIADELGLEAPTPDVRVVAHLLVGLPPLLRRDDVDAHAQLDATFAVLRDGWRPPG